MKIKSFAKILTAFWLAIGAVLRISQPSYAETTTFFCGTYKNEPATIAHTSRGNIPIVIWRSEDFTSSGYTPQRRCMEVTRKFQTYHNNGELNYIFAGKLNEQSVVCVARNEGGHCSGLLFILKPGSDPSRILQRILGIPNRTSGVLNEVAGTVYVNMNEYLNRVLFEEENAPSASPDKAPRGSPDEALSGSPDGTDYFHREPPVCEYAEIGNMPCPI